MGIMEEAKEVKEALQKRDYVRLAIAILILWGFLWWNSFNNEETTSTAILTDSPGGVAIVGYNSGNINTSVEVTEKPPELQLVSATVYEQSDGLYLIRIYWDVLAEDYVELVPTLKKNIELKCGELEHVGDSYFSAGFISSASSRYGVNCIFPELPSEEDIKKLFELS